MIDVNIPDRNLSNVDLLEIENITPGELQSLKQLFLAGLEATGNIRATCDGLDISRSVYRVWMKTDTSFRELVLEVKEGMLDNLETTAYNVALSGGRGSVPLLKFLLERQAKHRGYGKESKEIHEHGGTVDHKVWHHAVKMPDPPQNLAEWENQVRESRERRNKAIDAEYEEVEGSNE